MAKYSYEFKLKLVLLHEQEGIGYDRLAKIYSAPSSSIKRWVLSYNSLGPDSLKRSRQNKNYSFQFKLNAVQSYLTTDISYASLAIELGMNNPNLVTSWVSSFRKHGVAGLESKPKGRTRIMKNSAKEHTGSTVNDNVISTVTKNPKSCSEMDLRIKQLERRNLELEIENAYLKELRRLRLEMARKMNKQQELSIVSEDSTN